MAINDRTPDDSLVGLNFELGGGLGRMAGRIIGMASGLYVVQREGSEHFELMDIDDLRSARFFKAGGARGAGADAATGSGLKATGFLAAKRQNEPGDTKPSDGAANGRSEKVGKKTDPAKAAVAEAGASEAGTPDTDTEPNRRRLGDQIRKAVTRRTES